MFRWFFKEIVELFFWTNRTRQLRLIREAKLRKLEIRKQLSDDWQQRQWEREDLVN